MEGFGILRSGLRHQELDCDFRIESVILGNGSEFEEADLDVAFEI